MKRMLVSLSAALALAAQTPALAQDNTMPQYQPGQVFVFDNGRVEEVRGVNGSKITLAARSGRTYVRAANPIVPILEWSYRGQIGQRRVLGNPDALWPLRAGARADFRTINEARSGEKAPVRRSVHLWTCTVGRPAMVDAPAGRFQAFPIACDRFSPNSMRVLERIIWDYSPEVGHYVRRQARDMRDGQTETFSLFAALPPRESNAVRIEALARAATRGKRAPG